MDTNLKTKSRTDVAEQFGDMVEKGATQSKEALEKMSAATGQAADVMKNCYSTAVKGVQDYNNKVIEFTHANTKAAFDFAQRMSGVKSPSEFVELSTELAQQQLTTLTEQTKQLAALAQKGTLATGQTIGQLTSTSLDPGATVGTGTIANDDRTRISIVCAPRVCASSIRPRNR